MAVVGGGVTEGGEEGVNATVQLHGQRGGQPGGGEAWGRGGGRAGGVVPSATMENSTGGFRCTWKYKFLIFLSINISIYLPIYLSI